MASWGLRTPRYIEGIQGPYMVYIRYWDSKCFLGVPPKNP